MRSSELQTCEICGLEAQRAQKHHVLPKCKGGRHGATVFCCGTCGGQVHMLFTEKELAEMTLSQLLKTSKMRVYLKWRKSHSGDFSHRESNRVKKVKGRK